MPYKLKLADNHINFELPIDKLIPGTGYHFRGERRSYIIFSTQVFQSEKFKYDTELNIIENRVRKIKKSMKILRKELSELREREKEEMGNEIDFSSDSEEYEEYRSKRRRKRDG
jgi:hypothetical protein